MVLEAGCMEVPSIVTDINGCNEIIQEEVNGRIIPSHDAESLLVAMDWMLTHPSDVKRMSSNSRRVIQERYEQKDVWKALMNMYNILD